MKYFNQKFKYKKLLRDVIFLFFALKKDQFALPKSDDPLKGNKFLANPRVGVSEMENKKTFYYFVAGKFNRSWR